MICEETYLSEAYSDSTLCITQKTVLFMEVQR